jgi:hypothetical protein
MAFQELDTLGNVYAHLNALIHQFEGARAVVCIQQLEEGVGCVLCTHVLMVPCRP